MATIALSANRINQMPSMIKQVKQSVADYKSELFAIKMQTFSINQSICNLSEVVDSIQASTQTQEDKIDSLENMLRESEEFISDVVRIDDKAAEEINKRRDEFFEEYYYLKPDCEKSWTDKAKDILVSAGEWCRENWKSLAKIAVTIVIVAALGALSVLTGGTLAVILGAAFWGALSGALFGGAISGLANLFSGGSFLEGFADGALGGAIMGAIIGAAGAGGSIIGSTLGGSCKYAASAGKILKAFNYTSKISGILSFGMGAFDTAAMIAGFFNPDSFLAKLNRDLHSNSLYNAFQIGVTITAVFTGAAYASMRERMKFPPTCFIAGTLILTAFGLVAIENIKAGDKVLATDPDTFEQEEKTVVETYVNETQQLIHLTIQGETITTTWNHPFYVEGKGFVPAGELQVGDKTVGADGEVYAIENCQEEIVETPETVYNFQVEDFHTYYVGCAGVLVHNADCGKSKVLDDEGGSTILINIDEIRPKLKTEPDTAFFWSGRTDGIGGADNAANIAKSRGGVTLESTIESQNIVMPEWDFNNPSTMEAWDLASGAYAEQVSGDIRAVIGAELRKGNIWENIELPRLKNNPNVMKITTIDPKTGVEKIIFER